jgi:hypothetical protein
MRFYDDFIGSDDYDTTVEFIGGDADHIYLKNRKKQPKNWYYRDKKVFYSFNRWGHRSKNIEDINLDNYILFTGCSHTQGTGLEEDKTYVAQLSNKLNCDYYNLAIPATGIDVVEYNLLLWMARVKKKPKLVILQYPDHSRFTSYNESFLHLIERGTWDTEPEFQKFVASAEMSGLYYARKFMAVQLIKNTINVPLLTINVNNQSQYDTLNLSLKTIDFARDLSHSGIQSHTVFTDILYQKILQDKYMDARHINTP